MEEASWENGKIEEAQISVLHTGAVPDVSTRGARTAVLTNTSLLPVFRLDALV